MVLQGDSLVRFQKISIFHQTLCRKYYKTWRLARNDQMARKRNPGAQALHDSSFIPFFFFVWVLLFVCFSFKLLSYLRFLFFICLFLFFYLRLNPLGHHTIVIRCSVVLPQGVNKFILRVTVSTNKMDGLPIVFFIKLCGQLQTSRCTQIQHSGHLSWQFCSLQALISFETL